jgi:hypothetical protein
MFLIIITWGQQNSLHVSPMINCEFLIAFPSFSTKIACLYPCIVPLRLHALFTRVQHLYPTTPWPSIKIISRAVLCTDHLCYTLTVHWSKSAHPECLFEVTATAVGMGSAQLQMLEPPHTLGFLHDREEVSCCTQIHTVRLSDTHWGDLCTSWVHRPSVWRVAIAILSG